jgi:hypothetical protein
MSDDQNQRSTGQWLHNLRLPEPKLSETLAKGGHPRLAFVLDMTWLLCGSIPAVGVLALALKHLF